MAERFTDNFPSKVAYPLLGVAAISGWAYGIRKQAQLNRAHDALIEMHLNHIAELQAERDKIAEQRKELKKQAVTDPLTGLPNRRLFDEELKHEVARSRRSSEPLSVMFLDLDHFKGVNDTYGHGGGDAALVAVAGVIQRRLRKSDTSARYGGEEFVILLPDDDEASGSQVAEELRQEIKQTQIVFEDRCFSVTASIGVAEIDPRAGQDFWLSNADQALYAAKEQGRDRVVRYSSLPPKAN